VSRKWDLRFLGMARQVAGWSKDPSTQAGAVIVGPKRRVVSVGYNGFARKVRDAKRRYADRKVKYRMVVHAEVNAAIFAERGLDGCTLYTWPFMPCAACAGQMIQHGIARVVAPRMPADKADRWAEDMALAAEQFREAGVRQTFLELPPAAGG
jgi:dCMP deaminase